MSKFNEGDEIIVIGITKGVSSVKIGDHGQIVRVLDGGAYSVAFTNRGVEFLYDEEMELWKEFIRNKRIEELGIN